MAFHHVAITTKDIDATHRFYTEAMGFDLVKVEAQPTAAGWARHLFYDTGNGEMLAVWDINDDMLQEYKTDISTGLGLPPWANHIAFNSPDRDDLDMRLKRWLDNGLDAVRIDHDWCISIYADDPNGITVEFCMTTREFTDDDRAAAEALRAASVPDLNRAEPPIEFFTATANA
jgi:catechol 2,3-dioxygenase-like lactoylglutathione lyase family enzyme